VESSLSIQSRFSIQRKDRQEVERGYNRENGKIEKRQKVRRDRGDGVMDVEEIIIQEFLDLRNRETGGQ